MGGKPFNPRNRSVKHSINQLRLKNCRGSIWKVTTTKDRKSCFICQTKANFYCSGCNRYFCLDNRDDKLRAAICEDDPRVGFLEGKRPPAKIELQKVGENGVVLPDINEVHNGCFHIIHANAYSEAANDLFGLNPFCTFIDSHDKD